MILEVDNIELSFSDKRILNGIYLKAEQAKVTAILGSNGCGKTSLLKIIFGVLKSKYKLIRLDGIPKLKPLYKYGNTQFLPQHNFVPGSLKVSKLFEYVNLDWELFTEQFSVFPKYKNMRFRNLSGGERRVIETYIILKSKSKIVLLDEPFSHIAPLFVEKIKVLINEQKNHKVILMTDHMYRDVIEISDTIYLLKDGHTKLIDTISDLKQYNYLST